MFKKVIEYVNSLEKDLEPTKAYLYRLYGARRRLNNAVNKALEEVKVINNPVRYMASNESKFKKYALETAKTVLYYEFLNAISINEEFSLPEYVSALDSAISSDGTYKIHFTGSGWNKIINVTISLRDTAGNTKLWAQAVKNYRSSLGIKIPRKNSKLFDKMALQASRAWAGMWSRKDPKLLKTIQGRLSSIGNKPAFWEILDKGTPPAMSSDRGGYPTPKNKQTNFVADAEISTNDYLKTYMQSQRREADKLLSSVEGEINTLKVELSKLNKIIESTKFDYQLLRKVKESFGESSEGISDAKLIKALQLYRQGIMEGTIELTARGASRRTRKSLRSLYRLF